MKMNYIAADDAPNMATNAVKLHKPDGFKGMRAAGRLGADTLDFITPFVQPGVTTEELDKLCHDFILEAGAVPAPLNYRGFPKSICTSINHVVCHGIPGPKKLKNGDSLNIDVTVILDSWHGDTSRMYFAGKVPVRAQRLSNITHEAMMAGIRAAKPGNTVGDIGYAIQHHAEANRCNVVTEFCGHGIGRIFHDSPNIMNYGERGDGVVLKEGMFFTVEPMVNLGKAATKVLDDGWTAVTRDRSLSMQFEHSIGITADGCEIFTRSAKDFVKPPYNV
jgi:methionyl aminopeptidase